MGRVAYGASECSRVVCKGRSQEHLRPQLPQLPHPQWDGGCAGPLASCLAAPQPWGVSQIHQGNPERKRERAQSINKPEAGGDPERLSESRKAGGVGQGEGEVTCPWRRVHARGQGRGAAPFKS